MTAPPQAFTARDLVSLVMTFLLPPLAVRLLGWGVIAQTIILVLFMAGVTVYWLLYAGPGLVLCMASMASAFALWCVTGISNLEKATRYFLTRVFVGTIFLAAIASGLLHYGNSSYPSIDENTISQGKTAYEACAACHNSGVAPDLRSVIGRPAGQLEGYEYSEAIINSGLVWHRDTLAEFLRDPQGYLPGTKMAVSGLDEKQIHSVIAYLAYIGH